METAGPTAHAGSHLLKASGTQSLCRDNLLIHPLKVCGAFLYQAEPNALCTPAPLTLGVGKYHLISQKQGEAGPREVPKAGVTLVPSFLLSVRGTLQQMLLLLSLLFLSFSSWLSFLPLGLMGN